MSDDTYNLMRVYRPTLVDSATHAGCLALLTQMPAMESMYRLHDVYLSLITQWRPADAAYQWFFATTDPAPVDLQDRLGWYYDSRRMLYWFWTCLAAYRGYQWIVPRLPSGSAVVTETPFLALLHQCSFDQAINTWFAVCISWLERCDYQWYLDEASQHPTAGYLWEPDKEIAIPRYLAGTMALIFF
jgi:hypothetical protein